MALWIAAGAAVLFVLVLVIEGWARPGYSPVRHPVSALALGPRGWIQTVSFVASGGAIAVGALSLLLTESLPLVGGTLIVFGLGLIASGGFRMDPMRGYPPGTPERDPATFTRSHQWHDHAGAAVFLSLPIAAALAVLELPGVVGKVVAAASAIGLFIASAAFARAWEKDAPNTGLVQRAFIVPGWLCLAALFVHVATR